MPATLYQARVFHKRLRPKVHSLSYDLWAVRLNLADLPALAADNLLGGASPLSLRPADFGPRDGRALLAWAQEKLGTLGAVDFTFLPRWRGQGFSPISVFSTPTKALFEVHNTAGEAHAYCVDRGEMARLQAWKRLWVSPFSRMHGAYDFAFAADAAHLNLRVTLKDNAGPVLIATLSGPGQPLTTEALARLNRRPGLLGRRTFTAILWEAVKLRAKGLRAHWGPFAPAQPVTNASPRLDAREQTPISVSTEEP